MQKTQENEPWSSSSREASSSSSSCTGSGTALSLSKASRRAKIACANRTVKLALNKFKFNFFFQFKIELPCLYWSWISKNIFLKIKMQQRKDPQFQPDNSTESIENTYLCSIVGACKRSSHFRSNLTRSRRHSTCWIRRFLIHLWELRIQICEK